MQNTLKTFGSTLEGEFFIDNVLRRLYSTDASAYKEMPLAVAMPKSVSDIKKLIEFARQQKTSLIPRTAGTSLAGQVVGSGIVVDVSKYFTRILEVNKEERWVRLHPGVVRDDLNKHLAPFGLMFAPETSTANRAMVGGMVGNNSCGSNSVVYGSTREHLLEAKVILSDGSEAVFSPVDQDEFMKKVESNSSLENKIYGALFDILNDPENQTEIEREFPKVSIPRRNTGYAMDMLLREKPFSEKGPDFNLCSLLAGSEGTLAFITELKLNLVPLPPKDRALVCVHYNTIEESLRGNLIALKYNPSACELIDKIILDCTRSNIEQNKNRFFIQGDPGAILVVEIGRETAEERDRDVAAMIAEMHSVGLGYHFPVLFGDDMGKIWTLRKAGLGLLANMPGDAKAVPVIEDTAVDVNELPEYIREFNEILHKYGLSSVHYAHASTGELHLRPILDLKTAEGQQMFRTIAEEIATLVKKYKGSLSGEHGDGRLRGEFIPQMVGQKNYELMERIKDAFDPENILNPGKIVRTPPMDTSLRYTIGQGTKEIDTLFDFSDTLGIVRAAEQCNGSGDCRKTHLSGGTMCPSFMATRNEKETTRARANMLREMLTSSTKKNPFDHKEIKEVMDLCLSCKGCKSECPSNVDMGKLKAEFTQHYHEANGVPFRSRMVAGFAKASKLASIAPGLYNFSISNPVTGSVIKALLGFAQDRPIPRLSTTTFRAWFEKEFKPTVASSEAKGSVLMFCDEFTDYNDAEIGATAVKLLDKLGYVVEMPNHEESGRAHLSKGLIKEAKKLAEKNIKLLAGKVSNEKPLLGIEPSTIFSFRDEYIDLTRGEVKEQAREIAKNTFLIDEFLAAEMEKGNINAEQFTEEKKRIRLHGHCHQKALSSVVPSKKMLSLPKNYEVLMIPSGCCGMAGSFGYEKEHYEVSMQIGELVLFPTVRKEADDTIIAAPGTSCRHQIKDGTDRVAKHPVEVLWEALV
ncbi:MAG: FAD-binding and (Fe-S)-binding domain-containing protein [Imperialibacter sp.]|uniref:FAD-binding and (Fe-S)-binding domain-containing protein n=1 Tax=Imperialibacter sp. TaxID=2038411 RepID=UPI003A871981